MRVNELHIAEVNTFYTVSFSRPPVTQMLYGMDRSTASYFDRVDL
jgi:hypothetical protein